MLGQAESLMAQTNQNTLNASATHIVSHENKTDGVGLLSNSSSTTNLNSMDSSRVAQEMVIPRLIADEVISLKVNIKQNVVCSIVSI